MHERAVGALEVGIHAGGMGGGLCPRAKRRSVLPCLVMWPR
jgi:hypothetical protein